MRDSEYNIQPESPTRKIFAKTPTGETITLHVQLNETIRQIKKKIQIIEGIPPEEQRISFAGKVLSNERTLMHYKKEFVSLQGLLWSSPMRIFARTHIGKIINLDLKSIDTVKDVKKMIENIEGIPVEGQKISFLGKVLEDERTLFYYQIQYFSEIFICQHNDR